MTKTKRGHRGSTTRKPPLRPFPRKVHIKGKEWSYRVTGSTILIRDPECSFTIRAEHNAFTGMDWQQLEDTSRKGNPGYAIRPQDVKDFVENGFKPVGKDSQDFMNRRPMTPMGYERYLEKKDCHDCHAKPDELHDPGCDTEQCPVCGGQAITCEHGEELLHKKGKLWRERLPWSGIWSMTMEAVEYGFFVRWEGPRVPGQGTWVKCREDHPDAMPSRNDVAEHCRWDREKKRFVLR